MALQRVLGCSLPAVVRAHSTTACTNACLNRPTLAPILQENILRRGVDVVIGTPGRVKDHLERGTLDLRWAGRVAGARQLGSPSRTELPCCRLLRGLQTRCWRH